MSDKRFKYHLYDLTSMSTSPERYESDKFLTEAIKEVIAINAEANPSLIFIHDIDFRLVPLRPFKVSDDSGNETIQWAENADQAARLFLEETFDTTVAEV